MVFGMQLLHFANWQFGIAIIIYVRTILDLHGYQSQ